MMLIKMKTTLCGPDGNFAEGQIVDAPGQMSIEMAMVLVPNYAEDISPAAELTVESAVIAPQATAVAPAQRRGRKGNK